MRGAGGEAGFHLLDAVALVVGYGLASLLMRAFWPPAGPATVWEVLVAGAVYVWLGLAMSGPVVLMIRRPARREGDDADGLPGERSWSELAWMIVGFYWIGLTVLVVPVRMNNARFFDSAVLGVFPVAAALGLRLFGPKRLRGRGGERSWTHRAGVGLLASWPFVWVALILLGKSL